MTTSSDDRLRSDIRALARLMAYHGVRLRDARHYLDVAVVTAAMMRTHGDKTAAAPVLGVQRETITRIMRKGRRGMCPEEGE